MKKLINLLNSHPGVDEWKIINNSVSSTELFFVKDEMQINRAKDVTKSSLTVYKNFEIDGTKYTGSSSLSFSPIYTIKEISDKINNAVLAASFVRNEHYDLPNPTKKTVKPIESNFSQGNIIENIATLVKDLYEEDHQYSAFINSSEFFIDKKTIRIINSKGIDVSYDTYRGEIELITEANGEKESIELFQIINFGTYNQAYIKNAIKEQLYFTSLRAKAVPLPKISQVPVILSGKASISLWSYYLNQASAGQKYEHMHNNNINDDIQGEGVLGDRITLTLKPFILNSTMNRYFDQDGVYLEEHVIIKDGILKEFSASKKFADYLKVKPTGNINNYAISPGTQSEKELKKQPYLEVLSFSAFQMDSMTGNFGGEFRLAVYFDGEKEIPVTLGTVSGNIKTAQQDMYLSKELVESNYFVGPKVIKFNKMTIAGN